MKSFISFYATSIYFLERFLSHILLLWIRIWMGIIFIKSGIQKFQDIESTSFLFEYEYNLPNFLSPITYSYLITTIEIICPILLFIGLLSRFSSITLIMVILVIEIMVLQNVIHCYWLFLLFILVTYGPGCISLDFFVKKFFYKKGYFDKK